MSEILRVNGLSISLRKDKKILVDEIGFSVEEGQALVILGESGSGKTMTCNAIMDLLDRKTFAATGEILYGGKNLLALPPKERRAVSGREIAFIPQNPMTAFDPSMKIGKQMLETLRLHSDRKAECGPKNILAALEKAGLRDVERVYKSFPHELSGGMLQRVMIAMVLMVHARVVIADEPTTALDVIHRNETINAFKSLLESGTAVVMVTHDFAAASHLGGTMLVMRNGRIIERNTVGALLTAPREPYTKGLIEASLLSVKLNEVKV